MPAKTQFRVDVTGAQRKLARVRKGIEARDFRAILMDFIRKTLIEAAGTTPSRDAQTIRANQTIQYAHRINYIPSFHELTDPMLIVDDSDQHWIHSGGKWYRGEWLLPDQVWANYQDLLAERNRRMQTNRQEFINRRSQARFLYRKSWWQVGNSIGIKIPIGIAANSYSRHNPPKLPDNGYAIVHGGLHAISVDIRNPFLEQPSRYKSFSGKAILQAAANRHVNAFKQALDTAVKRKVRQFTS